VSEKQSRLLTGIFIGIAVYGILLFPKGQIVLNIAASCLAMAASKEMLEAADLKGRKQCEVSIYLLSVLLTLLPSVLPCAIYSLFVLLVFAFFAVLVGKTEKGKQVKQVHPAWYAMMLSGMIGGMPLLRKTKEGYFFLIVSITAVFLTDIGAYHIGKRFGRHKLIPAVSPNKTLEGALGGVGAALLFLVLLKPPISSITQFDGGWIAYLASVFLVSLAGQFGDLALSAVKRNYGIKDFGKVLPGHGGVLDRFDSQIFSAAMMAGLMLLL